MQSYLFCLLLLALPFSLFALINEGLEKPTVLIMLGPPASGKGTQSVKLAKECKLPHISTGDLFRENISKGTSLGSKAKSYIDQGELVPDEVVLDMLFDRLNQPDTHKGFILDGFPRTIAQAEALDQKIHRMHVIVLNLKVSDETILKRTAGRLICKNCGYVHNRHFSPCKVEGQCDQCGGELYQRDDDKPEVVSNRLKTYHKQTEPLINYYKNRKLLIDIDGEQPTDTVFQDLKEAVTQKSS
ncbi:adenylate kinase [Chlamydiales bacterium STE3]|nr:adenylate kinase [Chlamydiales bacterium STE3]